MKSRRVLLLTLLALLLLFGIPTGFLVREYRQERLNQELVEAIKADDTSAALTALKKGADPNIRTHYELSSDYDLTLIPNYAPSFGERMKQIFDRLLHHNVKKEAQSRLTILLLHLRVSREDNPVLVKALLEAHADPNRTGGSDGAVPMMWAVDGNHAQTLRLLLQHGGNPHLKQKDGWSPLLFATMHRDSEAVTLLLDVGTDIDIQANDGISPLYEASNMSYPEIAQELLQHHANPNLRDKDGDTPLDRALKQADTHLIQLLRQAGAKTGKELSSQPTTPPKR